MAIVSHVGLLLQIELSRQARSHHSWIRATSIIGARCGTASVDAKFPTVSSQKDPQICYGDSSKWKFYFNLDRLGLGLGPLDSAAPFFVVLPMIF